MSRFAILLATTLLMLGHTDLQAQSLKDLIDGKVGPGAPVLSPGGDQRDDAGAGDAGPGAGAGDAGAGRAGGPPPPIDDERAVPPPIVAEYWYTAGGKNHGPYALDAMKGLIAAGTLRPTSKVWHKGLDGWTDAKDEPTLAGLFPADAGGGADAWKTFMVGTWEATSDQDPLTLKINQTYTADGKMNSILTYYGPDLVNPGNLVLLSSTSVSGIWQVSPMSGERFQLTITTTKALDPTLVLDKKPHTFVIIKTGPNTLRNDSEGSVWKRVP